MVGFKVKYYWFQIGSEDFLFSFFSTVAYNLENKKWGTKFPVIMNELYLGELNSSRIPEAINELEQMKQGLAKYSPNKVIWNIKNLSAQPPWGTNISDDIAVSIQNTIPPLHSVSCPLNLVTFSVSMVCCNLGS